MSTLSKTEEIYLCKCIIPEQVLGEIVEKYGSDQVTIYWKGTKRDLEAIDRLYRERGLINQAIKEIEKK